MNDKNKVIIDTTIDQTSYEAIQNFCEEYGHTVIGKKLKEWLEYTEWDFAAWYVGDDV